MVIRRQGRYELTLSFSHTGIHRYRTLVAIWCKSTGKSLSADLVATGFAAMSGFEFDI